MTTTDPPIAVSGRVVLHSAPRGRDLETLDGRWRIRQAAGGGYVAWDRHGWETAYRSDQNDLLDWLTARYEKRWGPGMYPGGHARYDGTLQAHRGHVVQILRACDCDPCRTLHDHQQRSGRGPYRYELARADDPDQILRHVSRRYLIPLAPAG